MISLKNVPSPGALARARRWHDALDVFDELAFWIQNGEMSLVLGDLYVVMSCILREKVVGVSLVSENQCNNRMDIYMDMASLFFWSCIEYFCPQVGCFLFNEAF